MNALVPDYRAGLRDGLEGLRIGLPRHFHLDAEGLSPEVAASIDQAAETLSRLDAVVEEVTLPPYKQFNACGRVIMFAEAYAIHEQDFQQRPLDFALLTYMRMVLAPSSPARTCTRRCGCGASWRWR